MKYPVILTIALIACNSCEFLTPALPGPDWVYVEPPQDSISQPDTCQSYEVITMPKFITAAIQFDVLPTDSTWYVYSTPYPSLAAALSTFPYPFTIYQSGINLSVIIDSTNSTSIYQSKIWTRDGSGAKNYLLYDGPDIEERGFSVQLFEFYGSMKFFEFMNELALHPSARRVGFFNTGYSCEQVNEVISFFRLNCISGSGKTMDLRHVVSGCTIDAENMDYLTDANWTIMD